ncbi:MAG: cell division protein SepF [Clostridia bacterium]|nr:cell division protein SepF [Clostridia bacterium]
MAKIFGKLGEIFFGNEEDEFEEFEVEDESPKAETRMFMGAKKPASQPTPRSSSARVVSMTATTQLEVAVLQPATYEDASEIADRLKAKKAVVVNLEDLTKEDAIKVLDFISGVVYALEGNIQKVSSGIFLIAPYNVSIAGDVRDELKNKGFFPWTL